VLSQPANPKRPVQQQRRFQAARFRPLAPPAATYALATPAAASSPVALLCLTPHATAASRELYGKLSGAPPPKPKAPPRTITGSWQDQKTAGNAAFKAGSHAEAVLRYKDAEELLKRALRKTERASEQAENRQARSVILTNMGLAELRQGHAKLGAGYASEALVLNKNNAKAMFRSPRRLPCIEHAGAPCRAAVCCARALEPSPESQSWNPPSHTMRSSKLPSLGSAVLLARGVRAQTKRQA